MDHFLEDAGHVASNVLNGTELLKVLKTGTVKKGSIQRFYLLIYQKWSRIPKNQQLLHV